MGERAGHAYTAVPTHDHDDEHEEAIYRDGSDMQRDPTPQSHAAAKTLWPVKTRWLIVSLVLLAVPIAVPCSLAAVNGYKCADYWKGAGVFLFCGTLWASEVLPTPSPRHAPHYLYVLQAVPIWVTSVTVPLIAIVLRIGPGTSKELAHLYLSHFGEPNVLLMLGGFCLGRALQKLQIDRLLAGKVLSRAGSNPLRFLGAVMVACFILSMALNNVVAPVLMIMVNIPCTRHFFTHAIVCVKLDVLPCAGAASSHPRQRQRHQPATSPHPRRCLRLQHRRHAHAHRIPSKCSRYGFS